MMPAFFFFFCFQHTLNKLFNNYQLYKVILKSDKFFLKYKASTPLSPHPEKNTLKKPSFVRVKTFANSFQLIQN